MNLKINDFYKKLLTFPLGKSVKSLQGGGHLRIKDVCKATGLTDKTVRFYINSGLINPEYTENYAGRKNFSFSEKDITVLNKIAILRKYNFSVNDIKAMLEDNNSISEILENHINHTKFSAEETSIILNNLLSASVNKMNSVDDLCNHLVQTDNLPVEVKEVDYEAKIKAFWKKLKKKIPLLIVLVFVAVIVTIVVFILTTILFTNIFKTL